MRELCVRWKWRRCGLLNIHKYWPKYTASELCRSAHILCVTMKTTELENYLKWQQTSTAAIGRRLWEICIKNKDLDICKQNSEIRALKLEVYGRFLKNDCWYKGVQYFKARLKVIADVDAATAIAASDERKQWELWQNWERIIGCAVYKNSSHSF